MAHVRRRDALLALAGFGLLAAVARPASFRMPVDRDTGQYLYVADVLLHGGTPYADAANDKGPVLYLLFAAIQLVTGTSVVGVRLALLAVTAAAALFLALYVTARTTRAAGLLAGAAFAVLASTAALQGFDPNS